MCEDRLTARLAWYAAWLALLMFCLGQTLPAAKSTTRPTQELREARRQFQDAELLPARASSFIFNSGQPPRIVWRDVDEVRRLGSDGRVALRWFDAERNEVANPARPGRWGAYLEGVAPNGTVVRRAMTFYCRPPGFIAYWPANLAVPLEHQPGPIADAVWREHQADISQALAGMAVGALNDSEAGAILIAGLSESTPLGVAPRDVDSARVRNDDFHLAIKLKVQGLEQRARPLRPPARRTSGQARVLRHAPLSEAGARGDAKQSIDAVCQQWADDSGEGFVTLVARHGVILTHEAFGRDGDGRALTRDYRCDVASITKTATALLFAQFLDQDRIQLDAGVNSIFPDFPDDPRHVPTFRQCLTHMSGLTGHGDFGGCRNPYLENIILNGMDVNEPGKSYAYSGMGFDLVAKAMELVTGKSWRRVYEEHLYKPLGMGDVPMQNASSGARFTAFELALLAQLMANRGGYGDMQFFSAAVFEQMLPEPLERRYPGVTEVEGIGNHWMKHPKPGTPAGTARPHDLILSPRTIGHGSLTGCMFLIDLDRDLVVVQVRNRLGPRHAEWSSKFLQAVADSVPPATRETRETRE